MIEGPMVYTLVYQKGDGESETIHTHNRREAVRVYKEASQLGVRCALIDDVLGFVIASNIEGVQV